MLDYLAKHRPQCDTKTNLAPLHAYNIPNRGIVKMESMNIQRSRYD